MIETLNELASGWWSWMAQMTLQVSILIAFVYAFDLVTRRWVWPQLRLTLWLLVLLRLLLPPSLSSPWSVTAPVYTETSRLVTRVLVRSQAPPVVELPKSESVAPDYRPDGSGPPAARDPGTGPSNHRQASVSRRADSGPLRPSPTWQSWLLLIWAAVSITLICLLAATVTRLREEITGAWQDPELDEAASSAARTAGLRAPPAVRISSSVPTPAVVGLLRPVVLVPENHASVLRPEDLCNALLHEMCHIRRRDLLIQRAALLLHVVYWFNPLLWIVRRRIRHLTEMSCDARVVQLLRGESESYRATILRALRPLLHDPSPGGVDRLALLEHEGQTGDRIRWLSRPLGARYRIPVVTAVSLLVIPLFLPMVASSARPDSGGFTILRVNSFTPVGSGQSYLTGLDLLVGRPSESQGIMFSGQFSERENPSRMKIFPPSNWPFDPTPNCDRIGNRFLREDEVLGHRTLVFQTGPMGPVGVTEVYLAPDLQCLPLKLLTVVQDGMYETTAVGIQTGDDAVTSLGLPGPSEQPLEVRSREWRRNPPTDARMSYPGVRAAMTDQLVRLGDMPLIADYRRSLREAVRSVVWDEASSGATSHRFEYPFNYRVRAVIGPHDAYYLTRSGLDEIHRCNEDGRIVEAYPVGLEDLPATHRSFTVDPQDRLIALLQVRNRPEPAYRADAVRLFETPESFTDVPLSRPAPYPIDFSVDAAGRYYILRWNAPETDLRLVGRKVVPPSSYPLSVARYSPGGEFEQSLPLDSVLTEASAENTWELPRPASLAVLNDGRTFVLLLSNRTQGENRITSGRLFEIDWRNSALRPVPVETPAEGFVTLTDIHGLSQALVLEWSDYTSIPEGQPSLSVFAVKRLQLWQDGTTEPLLNIRGNIEALSAHQVLVTRITGPDAPWLFLVEIGDTQGSGS